MKNAATFWNNRYQRQAYAYGKEPNEFFRETLHTLPVGTILLPADGEGRNSVFAAKEGWQTTAFDISEAGREKALALANDHNVTIEYLIGPLESLPLIPHQFDVIACIYAHFPPTIRAAYNQRITTLLKPGGTLIFEAFSKQQLTYQPTHQSGGPKDAAMLFAEDDILAEFPGLHIDILTTEEVTLNEGTYHQGLASVVRFIGRSPQ